MPFISPHANVQVMLLNDRHSYPWITLAPLVYESEITGERYEVPAHFRTDGSSIPQWIILMAPPLAMRLMGRGVWQGFREGVLHDYLRRDNLVPAVVAHRVFREALYAAGYPPDLCEAYYAAVRIFNS